MKKKICIVINDINRALEHEWYVDKIDRDQFGIEFILINCENSFMSRFLAERSVPCYHYSYKGKADIFRLFSAFFILFLKNRYDVVHTHLFLSSLIALPAAWLAGIRKRIMTRHYSDFHHVWFPASLKYDRFMNRFVSDFIAISENVSNILISQENINSSKITIIHHGLDLNEYSRDAVLPEVRSDMSVKYMLKGKYPVVGVVSRFTELKGIQYVIPAFRSFLIDYPDSVLILANASGDYEKEISDQLKTLPEGSYRTIKFEPDIISLFSLFDMFIHVPVTATAEAFGQTYIEAMAMKVPGIFTLSGVLSEFGKDGLNCLVVPYRDSDAILSRMRYVMDNREVTAAIVQSAYADVLSKFDFKLKIRKIQELYLR